MIDERANTRTSHLEAVPQITDEFQSLESLKDALRAHEASHLSQIAHALSATVDRVSEAVERLEKLSPGEWMTAEQAAAMFEWESVGSFVKSDAPRHCLTPRVIRYHRDELREWGRAKPHTTP